MKQQKQQQLSLQIRITFHARQQLQQRPQLYINSQHQHYRTSENSVFQI